MNLSKKQPFNMDPETFADNLFGPEDERKATCIHCLKSSYEIHRKDGVCPGCQRKNLPGRTVLERRLRRAVWRARVFYGITIAFLIWFFFLR